MASSEDKTVETFGAATFGRNHTEPIEARSYAERIVGLIPSLFDRPARAVLPVSDLVASMIANCTADELLELDEQARWLSSWNSGPVWTTLQPVDVQVMSVTESSRGAILGLMSFHSNGHVREAAVRALGDLIDGTGLPFLLIRNNDWVANVQRCARIVTETLVQEGRFDFTGRNLELLFRLLNKQRAEHSDLVLKVVEQLFEPKHRPTLLHLLSGSNRFLRRNVFRLGLDVLRIGLEDLVIVGMKSDDPIVRLWAVRKVNAVIDSDQRQQMLTNAEEDSFLPVRREVLQMRLEHFPEKADSYLRVALLDRSPTMRELARFHLRKRGVTNFRDAYHAMLQEDNFTDVAVAGIGETGQQCDAALVLPYVASSRSRTRKAAVRAIGQLSPEQHMDLLLERLSDNNSGVSQEATRWLQSKVLDIGIARLWSLFEHDERPHVNLSVLRLADCIGAWTKLPLFIQAATSDDARVAAFAESKIESLYNRVFTLPSADERRKIQEALDKNDAFLEPSFRDSIRNWISLRS